MKSNHWTNEKDIPNDLELKQIKQCSNILKQCLDQIMGWIGSVNPFRIGDMSNSQDLEYFGCSFNT